MSSPPFQAHRIEWSRGGLPPSTPDLQKPDEFFHKFLSPPLNSKRTFEKERSLSVTQLWVIVTTASSRKVSHIQHNPLLHIWGGKWHCYSIRHALHLGPLVIRFCHHEPMAGNYLSASQVRIKTLFCIFPNSCPWPINLHSNENQHQEKMWHFMVSIFYSLLTEAMSYFTIAISQSMSSGSLIQAP